MSEIVRMVVVLSLIAGSCSAALTVANKQLGPKIEEQTDFYVRGPALENLFGKPAKDILGNKIVINVDGNDVPIFFTKDGDTVATLAIEATSSGFGGDLTLMFGVDLINSVQMGMEVVSHSETPGLGARIVEPAFRKQWKGLSIDSPVAVTADGGEIDAISGATTTSRAAVNGTNEVMAFVKSHQDEILKSISEL